MNTDIAKLWVAALRSGKYKQGRSALNEDGRFCCLGVLCELAIEAGVGVHKTRDDFSMRSKEHSIFMYDGKVALMPESVRQWAGIKQFANSESEVPNALCAIPDGTDCTLATLNDNGQSFEQIARVIETYADRL